MINAKGEFLYSCSEIGYALGINPNTVRAGAKRLYGNTFKMEFTIPEAQRIKAYFMSVSPEQEEVRIKTLFEALGVTEKEVNLLMKTYEQQLGVKEVKE